MAILILWLGLDVIIGATFWYGFSTIALRFPEWWQRAIVGDAPDDIDL